MYCLFIYLFFCLYCLFPVAIVKHRWLWESSRAQRLRLWVVASGRARQVALDHIDHMCFFSLVHILACVLLYCYQSLIPLGFGFHTWLVLLSHAVSRVIQVFPSFVMLSWLVSLWEWCGLPSVEMWFDRVRIDAVVWAMVGTVEMVNTVMTCGARIC
jgi:hypothetical protein